MLTVENLRVAYETESGPVAAVDGVGFTVGKGEFFTLLGPSGCGKTTILRSVAGFETPQGGSIAIGGAPVFDAARGANVPVHKRDIAMVFQSYAIWPHMTVAENVGFPLAAQGIKAADARPRIRHALEMVGLGALLDRPATQLSGGQQQRVALARAIAKNASLLLLDEPLSNLDAQLREQMRGELAALQSRLGTTTLYVTHDQEEALSLSGRIALMQSGRIVEVGTPRNLYYQPRRLFTARFLGRTELFPCTLARRGPGEVVAETSFGTVSCMAPADVEMGRATLMIRPEHVCLVSAGEGRLNVFDGVVRGAVFLGRVVEYEVELRGGPIRVQALSGEPHEPGARVRVHLPSERCVAMAEPAGAAGA